MTAIDRQRLERGAQHVHTLGARATAEALADIAERTGELRTVLAVLADYRQITRAQLQAAGADRFPPRPLRVVQA